MLGEVYWIMGKAKAARESYMLAWSFRSRVRERADGEAIVADIRKALVRSGVVAEGRDADAL
jgi:hypothetical protein